MIPTHIKNRTFAANLLIWGTVLVLLFGWIPRAVSDVQADSIMEVLFALAAISMLLQRGVLRKSIWLPLCLVMTYLVVGFVLAVVWRGVNIYDFMMAYKFGWYLFLLLPFCNSRAVDALLLSRLLRMALFLFLVVYLLKMLMGNERPTYFTENNFELLFLCLLFYARHIANGSSELVDISLLLAVAIISGSRSGAALAAVVTVFAFDFKRIRRPSTLVLFALAAIGVVGAAYVFSERSTGGIESIDRYRFFLAFLAATADWRWWDYLIGAPRITPLPDYVCSQLSFYSTLFSYRADGSCYSVILHSFNLRVVFDHGLLVALGAFALLRRVLINCSLKEFFCISLLILMNGLSVSSLNSVYTALGVAFIASAIMMQPSNGAATVRARRKDSSQ